MLKKLRIKFIIITMLTVIVTLAAIMTTVNTVNYFSVVKSADKVVDFLCQNNGKFPEEFMTEEPSEQKQENNVPFPPDAKENRFDLPKDMSQEAPFDTRFFSVYFKDDQITKVNTDKIAAVSEEEAADIAISVLSKNRSSGTYDIYRYRVQTLADGEKMVLFVDISKQLTPMKSFLTISLIVMAVCIAIFFVVIVLISKPVLKPIAESYKRQKRFITDAGHELKTPLTIISANNEIQELETGETECTQAIGKQVARMTNMVKNLTELAKMDEEEVLRMKNFNLSSAFDDVSSTFKNVFEKSGKKLSIHIQDKINYFGIESMIRRLFTLLLENSSKYSSSFADAELTKKGRNIRLIVQNDATGITEGDQSKCFERFYRSDEARASQTEGSGIGLSTAQETVLIRILFGDR